MYRIKILTAAALLALGAMPLSALTQEDANALENKRQTVGNDAYFAVLDRPDLTPEEREALQWVYAYSPVADIVNVPADRMVESVRTALRARTEMPWGKVVPEREWQYFVLPPRINNEPMIDDHRPAFYDELKDRVKGLSMKDAVLEVNHWCHEYVTYEPSDGRTRTPLQSKAALIGRCGEESTFTVAALRAVGIPARQVYTPRWAHTDDNHAWVEAWVDGAWHFFGACEPAPVLDMAWFNAPATRGMMMHTFVRGNYDGPEDVVAVVPDGVNINVTATYAPVVRTTVTVVDADGKPVADSKVSFSLYNYAEYYPLTTATADAAGHASATTGVGDMVIWAYKDGAYGVGKAHAGDNVTVALTSPVAEYDFDLVPPVPGKLPFSVTDEQTRENDRRLAAEDRMRNDRAATTFYAPGKVPGASPRLEKMLTSARSNWTTIADFVKNGDPAQEPLRMHLLDGLTTKDLGDVTREVLDASMQGAVDTTAFYAHYVLSPRISREYLQPLKERKAPGVTPQQIIKEVESLTIIPDWTPRMVTMNAEGVAATGKGNRLSRDVYFVALARANNIPARIDPVTGVPQWADLKEQKWHDVIFDAPEASRPKGKLQLVKDADCRVFDPAYFYHFSLSRIGEDGNVSLLDFPGDGTLSKGFDQPVEVDAGRYLLTSGQRLASGEVLAHSVIFDVPQDATVTMPVKVRHDDSAVAVIGNFNAENLFTNREGKEQSLLSATGRGYYVVMILDPGKEPTNHVMRDVAQLCGEFEKQGIPMVLLLRKGADPNAWTTEASMANLPANAITGTDADGRNAAELIENLRLSGDMPIVAIADTFNRVVYVTEGYTIGAGQRILDTLCKL